jgi:hypothetical protein
LVLIRETDQGLKFMSFMIELYYHGPRDLAREQALAEDEARPTGEAIGLRRHRGVWGSKAPYGHAVVLEKSRISENKRARPLFLTADAMMPLPDQVQGAANAGLPVPQVMLLGSGVPNAQTMMGDGWDGASQGVGFAAASTENPWSALPTKRAETPAEIAAYDAWAKESFRRLGEILKKAERENWSQNRINEEIAKLPPAPYWPPSVIPKPPPPEEHPRELRGVPGTPDGDRYEMDMQDRQDKRDLANGVSGWYIIARRMFVYRHAIDLITEIGAPALMAGGAGGGKRRLATSTLQSR